MFCAERVTNHAQSFQAVLVDQVVEQEGSKMDAEFVPGDIGTEISTMLSYSIRKIVNVI